MKKYILAKDLPDHPAGTELVMEGESYWTPDLEHKASVAFNYADLKRAIETGWVKGVEDRVGLMPENVRISGGLAVAEFISKYSGELFTLQEITLMEKALNGELVDVDLREFMIWYSNEINYFRCRKMSHAELLKAFNAREK